MFRFTLSFVFVGAFAAGVAAQESFAIKFRGPKEGDKTEVIKSRDGTVTVTAGKMTQTNKEAYRYEYTETVIEKPDDAPKPTRADRKYRVAKKTDQTGELKLLSYHGKTVEIQVSPMAGIGYIFIVAGNAIQPPEVDDFLYEFQGGPKPGAEKPKPDLDVLLPKKAVKVGEEWTVDFATIESSFGGKMPFTLEREGTKFSGKLVKAYQKDGAQWGTLEFKVVMAVSPAPNGPPVSGTITTDVTVDMPIDGSSPAKTVKLTGKGTLTAGKPGLKLDMSVTQSETVTPVK